MRLVFVHGAGDSSAVWQHQVDYFGAEHDVLALDMPGHGARLGERAFTTHDDNATEIARLALGPGAGSRARTEQPAGGARPVLIGHSGVGAACLVLALRQPELAAGLVLVASGARMRMAPDLLERARAQAATPAPGLATGSLVPLDLCVSPATPAETREWLARQVGQATAQATLADFEANHALDVMGQLGEVRTPTLVLGGADDRLAPPKFQQFLADGIPGARLVVLPGAGHYPHAEQPAAFNRAVDEFLAGVGV